MSSVQSTMMTAINMGKRVSLMYHGEQRIVEPHAVGVSTKGNPCVRVFQVMGGAVFGPSTGWKMLTLADVDHCQLLDVDSDAPRFGFSPGDKGMSSILLEVHGEPIAKEAPS